MCAWRCSGSSNLQMAISLKNNDIIKSSEVEAAFLATDRAHFCPKEVVELAYEDRPIKHKHIHMSAPHIYASSLEYLDLKEGNKFLCIGSGTGYFCHLVKHIIGPKGIVHGIEIYSDVVSFATAKNQSFEVPEIPESHSDSADTSPGPSDEILSLVSKYSRQKTLNPQYITGNCFDLKPENNIRYDRIYVAAGAPRSMCKHLSSFLQIAGILVGPFDDALLKVTRRSETSFSEVVKAHVRFAPLLRTLSDQDISDFSQDISQDFSEEEERESREERKNESRMCESSMEIEEIALSLRGNQGKPKRRRVQGPKDLTFKPIIWSSRSHCFFPSAFQKALTVILIYHKRRDNILARVSRSTWFYIFQFMNRDWFDVEVSEVELLRRLLAAETQSRIEAEARVTRAERERDRAMMMMQLFFHRGTNQDLTSDD
ncbi:hypothetical protein AAMO2058_000392000 [Amorphochlora amoebiformis]